MDTLTSERIGRSRAATIVRLLILAHRIDVRLSLMLADIGQTVPEALLLFFADTHDHVGLGSMDLARMLGVNRTTIGRVVRRLASRGMIVASTDPRDRRFQSIRLTDAGREQQAFIVEQLENEAARVFARFGDAELAWLVHGLDVMEELAGRANRHIRPPRPKARWTSRYC